MAFFFANADVVRLFLIKFVSPTLLPRRWSDPLIESKLEVNSYFNDAIYNSNSVIGGRPTNLGRPTQLGDPTVETLSSDLLSKQSFEVDSAGTSSYQDCEGSGEFVLYSANNSTIERPSIV